MERSALDDKIREGKQFLSTVTDISSLDAAYDANKITLGEYNAKRKELESKAPANTSSASTTGTVTPGVQPPSKNTPPVITDAEKKQAMDQLAALDADWAAGKISSKDEYNAKRVELFKSPAFNAAIDDRSSGSNPTPYNSSSANNQPQPPAQPTLADDIDKMWSDKGYVKDANGDWVLPEEVQQQNTAPAYTPPAGITPPAAGGVVGAAGGVIPAGGV